MAQLLSSGDFHPECHLRYQMGKYKALAFPSTLAKTDMVPRLLCPGLPDQIRKREPYDNEAHYTALFTSSFLTVTLGTPRNWLRERAFRSLRTAWWPAAGQAKRNAVNNGFHSLDPPLDTWPPPRLTPQPCNALQSEWEHPPGSPLTWEL